MYNNRKIFLVFYDLEQVCNLLIYVDSESGKIATIALYFVRIIVTINAFI